MAGPEEDELDTDQKIRRGAGRRSGAQRSLLCFAAIVPALAASLLHSLVDFVWYVPGLMVVVVVLAACACRLWQGIEPGGMGGLPAVGDSGAGKLPLPPAERTVPRVAWLTAGLCLLAVGVLMAKNRFSAAGMGQRFLFVDRSGTGEYFLESSNIVQGEE